MQVNRREHVLEALLVFVWVKVVMVKLLEGLCIALRVTLGVALGVCVKLRLRGLALGVQLRDPGEGVGERWRVQE